jgi:predicted SprT family Zn-dependent metalloprotease
MPKPLSPTQRTYDSLNYAHGFFNDRLFGGGLSPCMITMQRSKKAYGYFAGARFGVRAGKETTDEIALNPSTFAARTETEILSTLVHEMAHQWQQQHGKPSRTGYHNKEWANKMRAVGLVPSSTGQPGGQEVGQKVSHYIAAGGVFAVACADLLASGRVELAYIERWGDEATRKKKAASKTKYTCGSCGANAWAKPETHLICGECDEEMHPEPVEPGEAALAVSG